MSRAFASVTTSLRRVEANSQPLRIKLRYLQFHQFSVSGLAFFSRDVLKFRRLR